jgi:hypothetical protein
MKSSYHNYREIPIEFFKKRIKYDNDGSISWKFCDDAKHHWNLKNANKKAGYIGGNRYKKICLTYNGKKYYISNHVVVFILNKNKYPDNMLDHINGIKTDNRIENLREADSYQNVLNKPALKNKKSQYKGVSWVKNRKSPKKWAIATTVRGVVHPIKYFYDELEAAISYNELVKKLHDTEFAYMNDISNGYTNKEYPNMPRHWVPKEIAA